MPEFFWGDPSDYRESEVKTIAPYDVVYDPDVYPRELVGEDRVEKYTQLMEDGHEFPPIMLEKSTDRLLDGKARLEAAKNVGRDIEYVTVDIKEQDPTLVSAWFNAKHGESLSTEEKKDLAHQSVFNGLDDPTQLSALLSTPQRKMTRWVEQFKGAREEKKLEETKELIKQGKSAEKVVSIVDWPVDKIEKIKDRMMSEVKGGSGDEEDKTESSSEDHSTISSEWEKTQPDEEEEKSEEGNPRIACKYCGGSTFRLEDKGGTCSVSIDDGKGSVTEINENGPSDGYYVSCELCGETLETERSEVDFIKGTSLYEKLLAITEGISAPADEDIEEDESADDSTTMVDTEVEKGKATKELDTEEPQGTPDGEEVPVDDREIFAAYNRSPLGIDYWTTDEMSLNLIYHFSQSGDFLLELFNRDNSILDFGSEMGRNVIAYNSNSDREDVREWDTGEFVNDVSSGSVEYAFTSVDRRFLDDSSITKILEHVAPVSERVIIYSDLGFKDMCELKVELTSKYEIEYRIAVVGNKFREPEYRGDIESGYYRELFVLKVD